MILIMLFKMLLPLLLLLDAEAAHLLQVISNISNAVRARDFKCMENESIILLLWVGAGVFAHIQRTNAAATSDDLLHNRF